MRPSRRRRGRSTQRSPEASNHSLKLDGGKGTGDQVRTAWRGQERRRQEAAPQLLEAQQRGRTNKGARDDVTVAAHAGSMHGEAGT